MAVDKLIDSALETACRTAEADAIRAKTGEISALTYDFTGGQGFSAAIGAIPLSVPTDVSTAAGMSAVLTAANIGRVFRFTGTTDETYVNGDLYLVEVS